MRTIHAKSGFAAFYLTVIFSAVGLSMTAALFAVSQSQLNSVKIICRSSQALYLAEGGLEDAVYRVIKNKKYDAVYNLVLGEGVITLNVTENDNSKTIISSGLVVKQTKVLSSVLTTETDTVSFHYGAQVDKGGLNLGSNAKVVGNVYANGNIIGSGLNSQITGDAWVAGALAPDSDQEWIVKNSDFEFGLKKDGIYYLDTAQSFKPSVSKVLNKAGFYLKKQGLPPNQTIRLVADNAGKPSKTVLSTATLQSSKVTAAFSWVEVSFDPAPLLTANQTYWLMIDVSRDDSNYWVWGKDSTDNYLLGTAKYSADWSAGTPVWDSVNGDLDFKTYMGGENPTKIDGIKVGVDAHANTILNSYIGRDAYYQAIDQNTQVIGTKFSGSVDPATKDLPISLAQIQDWEVMAEAGGIIQGNYQPALGATIGPVKINGNLTIPQNSLDNPIIIGGPIWVVGNISAQNNSKIKLSPGATSGYSIIADNPADRQSQGRITLSNNIVTQDNDNGYLLLISINESLNPSSPAISISNNVNASSPASIIFAISGLINVSNNAKFKEVCGYAVKLENNAEVVYEEGLFNSNFSSGPGAG
ncbi:MAG: hypothetical protein Q8N56_04355, partial [bacterium]|nr:hypothetical protein [bacterium]